MSMSDRKKKIAFTGGGSGWHILPIISLMQYIDDTDHCRKLVDSVYRFGEKTGMEYNFYVSTQALFQHIHPKFISIVSGKYRRETIRISRLKNIRDIFLFPFGILQSIFWLRYYDIDVVFCKWGYVALPVVLAAWILRKSIYVHDSDTTPGLTNRLASRFSTKNFSGFPNTLPHTVCVGQILSNNLITSDISPLVSDRIEVLIAGWSLGAKKLYQGVLTAIKQLWIQPDQYHFTFINGDKLIEVNDSWLLSDTITITGLIQDQAEMGRLYAQSDFAIVRGGTTTLAECKLFDLPLVIVPLPVTHDQQRNAQWYVDTYHDILLDQNDISFVDKLQSILHSASKRVKSYDNKKILHTIQHAKKIIINEMLWL